MLGGACKIQVFTVGNSGCTKNKETICTSQARAPSLIGPSIRLCNLNHPLLENQMLEPNLFFFDEIGDAK